MFVVSSKWGVDFLDVMDCTFSEQDLGGVKGAYPLSKSEKFVMGIMSCLLMFDVPCIYLCSPLLE